MNIEFFNEDVELPELNYSLIKDWLSVSVENEKHFVVVGTRNACFLPLHNFSQIVFDAEHEANHKHWDQAPRFHAMDIIYYLPLPDLQLLILQLCLRM